MIEKLMTFQSFFFLYHIRYSRLVILSPFAVILSPFAVILSPFAVILSEAKNLYRRPLEPVRRGVAGLTPLRIDDAIQSIY